MAPITFDAQAISGITGSISIACWIIVFTPQLYENFARQSADGLSFTFVVLWLAGDVFNVLGSILQGVLPTMIILAIYYTLADVVLLIQCLMYHRRNTKSVDVSHLSPATPLVVDEATNYESVDDTPAPSTPVPQHSRLGTTLFNILLVVGVFLSGFAGWWLTPSKDTPGDEAPALEFDLLGQIFGWLCAALYLGSRVPQIVLNYERKSVEGISFLFFLFACLGNTTYVISIITGNDITARYLLINASWLLGSVGTLFLDFLIFCQFWIYNHPLDDFSDLEDD